MATKKSVGIGVAIAAGAGAAAIAVKNHKKAEQKAKKAAENAFEKQEYRNTEIGKMKRTAKEFTIPTATMRHLQDRKNRKA